MGKDILVFHELFNVLVFQFRLVSVEYFLDTMTEWEINDLIEYLPYLDRNLWESCRLNTYITAQINSTKEMTMQDICKFKWEDTVTSKSNTEISNEDINRLREMSKHIKI